MKGSLGVKTAAIVFALAAAEGAVGVAAQQHSTADRMPALIDPSLVGSDVFRSFCAPCHGRDGTGGGPVASALKNAPADLTRIRIANGGQFPRRRIEEFVTSGKSGIAAHGSGDMPIWGPTFRSLEPSDALVKIRIANVVAYLESIQK